MKLGMLGMWHTHADGIVRQVAGHPDEFSLVGFYDPDPDVVAGRRKTWGSMIPGFRVFESPELLLRQEIDGVVVEGRVFENLKLARLALELVVPTGLVQRTMVLALPVLVPLALAVLELAPINPAVGVVGLFQPFSPNCARVVT